jgi:transcriptional antiterminator NusG
MTSDSANWYVVQVLTGNEVTMCRDIHRLVPADKYERCFVPMAEHPVKRGGQWQKVEKPLFPGYFFVISQNIEAVHQSLWSISQFKRILSADGRFVPLTDEEVERFRALTDQAFNMTLSKGFIVGDQITVTEGPLKGQEGLIKKIDRHKRMAFIELLFLGKPTRVRVPLEIVDKR